MTREQELEKLIVDARKAYYGNPLEHADILTDEEYDALEQELRSLNPDSSVLNSVGAFLEDEKREKLSAPMLSQEKALNEEETNKIIKSRFPDSKQVYITEKLDGCGLDLTYVEGKLVSAITRGTWIEGTQVLKQALLVKNIPHTISKSSLKEAVHVRGEVVISFKDFEEINKEQDERKEERFSNPRNLAAGTIKIENLEEVKRRRLQFVAYEIFAGSDIYESPIAEDISNSNKIELLSDLGFTTPVKFKRYANAASAVYDSYAILREADKLPWPIDGVVVKLDDRDLCRALGETTHHPRGSFAIKPLPESAWVTIDHIDWTISRRGVVSPTAVFEKVQLSGADISRVMLFNLNNLERFNAYPGTKIKVIRSGLVIPRCIDSDYHAKEITGSPRPLLEGEAKAYIKELGKWAIYDKNKIKEFYPSEFKGNKLEEVTLSEDGARVLRVVDRLSDPFTIAKKIEHLLQSIRCLGFGEAILTEYVENSKVGSVSEFISTFKNTSLKDNITSRSISIDYSTKLFNALQKALVSSEAKDVIKGLGIEKAVSTVDKIVKDIKSFEDILDVKLWKKYVTEGILSYIEKDISVNAEEYRKIMSFFKFNNTIEETGNALSGHSFVITGTLPVKRSEVEALIKANGGLVGSSVSKRTTYLIAGEDCGSKLEAAKKLGVKIISYEEFKEKFSI